MEAGLWEEAGEKKVKCGLCSHNCLIKEGARGICNVRENRGGVLHSLVYDRIIAAHVDPIEKKPLFHFYPGSLAYSVGTAGCNFRCRFCQNADIAHLAAETRGRMPGRNVRPEDIVGQALRSGCRSIAYTYNEPTVFFELALDTAMLAHQQGLKNVFVTNGYMSGKALDRICPYLDAANVDLKAFSDEFYRTWCSARIAPVMQNLRQMKKLDIFVEVTTLIIPGLNDDPDELRGLAGFIADELGTETPWHVSRFHPCYLMTDRPPTPVEKLIEARDIGLEAGLRYVYTGNVPGERSECTWCYSCGALLIERKGFSVYSNLLEKGLCPECGAFIHGVGMCEAEKI